jgi:two-component system OmpR family response regulator
MNDQGEQSARILVVDDDPAMRRVLVNYLADHNMRAMSASGRQERVHLLAVRPPRLVTSADPEHLGSLSA